MRLVSAIQTSLFDGPVQPQPMALVVLDRQARSLDRAFTYQVPERLSGSVKTGSYVLVPFGRERVPGYVVGFTEEVPDFQLRDIAELLVGDPLFCEADVELARALSSQCFCSFVDAIKCFLPPGATRRDKRLLRAKVQVVPETLRRQAPRQAQALEAVLEAGGECAYESLRRCTPPDALPAAVAGLVARGLLEESRVLQRPAASARCERVVSLREAEMDWQAEIEALRAKAPRQVDVIEALLKADGRAIPTASLNAAAVQALAKRGWVETSQRRLQRRPEDDGLRPNEPATVVLNEAQTTVLSRVTTALDARTYQGILIHGVTGSGKTEVYLHAIEMARVRKRGAIVLVPEIALTPQMVGRFRARFGDRLALLHSALGAGERFDEWGRVHSGTADIVIGARSAVFAPVRNLGIIVIDEEHDRAYKQESPPRYDAREVAAQRAARSGAVLLLGSATPSLETYWAATASPTTGLELATLPARIDDRPLPDVTLVDLRRAPLMPAGGQLSEALLDALRDRLAAGEQTILFLNRRGFSTFVMCRECGQALRCPACAVSLTYHHRTRLLRCHHCDFTRPTPNSCDGCGGTDVGFHGTGTERVADQVARLFPEAQIARMDRDTTTQKGAHGAILRRLQSGEADILIGTQMIAKGLHLPAVTLVGVLNADTGLNRPDFRAAEHTFQLVTQVAGRAGRADKTGSVLVQTYSPDHYAIAAAAQHDFPAFFDQELERRREHLYPPFARLINVVLSDTTDEIARAAAHRLALALREVGVGERDGTPQYLGPAECPLHKLRGRYRHHVVLKGEDFGVLRASLSDALAVLGDTRSTSVTVDADPVDMM